MVTSRSPRYYVSAAYWDRDSLLWSFPAVLQADPTLARRMLGYVFGRQRRNIGAHSRFIDGTVLELGFELDELMAPLLALERYADATGDTAFLHRPEVEEGVAEILGRLAEKRHPAVALYETFLQPTDDERVYPYLTHDNVLVWRGLRAAARFYSAHTGQAAEAEAVRAAIRTHCVKTDADGAPYLPGAWTCRGTAMSTTNRRAACNCCHCGDSVMRRTRSTKIRCVRSAPGLCLQLCR